MELVDTKNLARMYIGIDISKEIFEICLMDKDGKVCGAFQIGSDRSGFNNLLNSVPENVKPLFSMESTGPFTGNLVNFLRERDLEYIVSNPFDVSRLREAFSNSVKNDVIDAFVLAQAARMQVIKGSSKGAVYVFLQDILERHFDLKDRQTALTNQIRANLVQTFPELAEIFDDITCKASLAILMKWQCPTHLLKETNTDNIRETVRQSGGRLRLLKMKKLLELCKESVAWKTSEIHSKILISQVREMQIIKDELVKIGNLLEEYSRNTFPKEIQVLKSLPGFGDITSNQLLAVIGDHKRFDPNGDGKGAKRFSSFIGYSIKEYSSGPKKHKSGINKRGNSRLRGLLYIASFTAIRMDKQVEASYLDKKSRGGGKKSTVSISHLLARRAYGVLKSGKMYNSAIPLAGG